MRNLFFPFDGTTTRFWVEMTAAVVIAALTTRLGMTWGNWMRRIRR